MDGGGCVSGWVDRGGNEKWGWRGVCSSDITLALINWGNGAHCTSHPTRKLQEKGRKHCLKLGEKKTRRTKRKQQHHRYTFTLQPV